MTEKKTPAFDFSAQAVTSETTREYTFDLIPGAPSIVLAPAHDSNPAYLDERLRMSIDAADKVIRVKPGKKPEKPTPEVMKRQIEDDRDTDRQLIAKACARAWGTAPKAVDGSRPEFDQANCLIFLRALPDYMFDPFRNFAQNLYNFVDRPALSEDDGAQLGE